MSAESRREKEGRAQLAAQAQSRIDVLYEQVYALDCASEKAQRGECEALFDRTENDYVTYAETICDQANLHGDPCRTDYWKMLFPKLRARYQYASVKQFSEWCRDNADDCLNEVRVEGKFTLLHVSVIEQGIRRYKDAAKNDPSPQKLAEIDQYLEETKEATKALNCTPQVKDSSLIVDCKPSI